MRCCAVVVQKRQQFCATICKNIMAEHLKKWNEGDMAGQIPDMGIKTVQGMDSEGHLHGSKESEFDERSAQAHQKEEDNNELNQKDARSTVSGTEGV